LILTFGCKTPPVPPEAERANALEGEIWRAGGSFFLADEYEQYRRSLADVRARVAEEKAEFGWFRDYKDLQIELRDLVTSGESLLVKIGEVKSSKSTAFAAAVQALEARVERLKEMTLFFNESDEIRRSLAQADIKIGEAGMLVAKEKYGEAETVLSAGAGFVENAWKAAAALLRRYLDRGQMARWRTWADETIAESREKKIVAFLVNKIERTLTVYRNGAEVAFYEIGLGKYGLSDKLYAGDEATPEGKYRIVRKFPESAFYKALLIDYPNEEDRRTFAEARRKGSVPAGAGIGGAIEIHGGGKDSLTKGCVGLENKDMDEVFDWAEVGTPVTIVGAVSIENTILADILKYSDHG